MNYVHLTYFLSYETKYSTYKKKYSNEPHMSRTCSSLNKFFFFNYLFLMDYSKGCIATTKRD